MISPLQSWASDRGYLLAWGPLAAIDGVRADLASRIATGEIDADLAREQLSSFRFANENSAALPAWVPPVAHNALIGCLQCQHYCPVNPPLAVEDTGVVFSEEETSALIGGTAVAPESTREKLAPLGLTEEQVIGRNLRMLVGRERVVMGTQESNPLAFLIACAGRWSGTSTLHDPHTNAPAPSQSDLEVAPVLAGRFARLDYTWSYEGVPQEGSLLVGFDPTADAVTGHWIDTWHMGRQVMALAGTKPAGNRIALGGTCAAPPGADWGWRIELTLEPDALRIAMFNVSPDGHQEPAVDAAYSRRT